MNVELEGKGSSSSLVRRASWGGLEIAALAAVKAMADEEKRERKRRNPGYRIYDLGRSALRLIGILPDTNVELNRHIAATKIQRAWRSRLAKPTETRSEDGMQGGSIDESSAWTGRDSASALVLKKRSMLSRNGHSTKNAGRLSDQTIRKAKANELEIQLPANGGNRNKYCQRRNQNHPLRGRRSRADHSQVGNAMAEVTGQRVGIFILFSLLFVLLFTYYEIDSTQPSTMVVLHGQTIRSRVQTVARRAVDAARQNAVPK